MGDWTLNPFDTDWGKVGQGLDKAAQVVNPLYGLGRAGIDAITGKSPTDTIYGTAIKDVGDLIYGKRNFLQEGGQGPQPTASATAPAASAQQSILDQLLAAQQAQQNPYGQQYIQGQQQQARLAFQPQQQALSGALAGRGMMGSGAEVAQRTGLAGAQGASLLDIANRAGVQGNQWQQEQNRNLFNMGQGIEQNKIQQGQLGLQRDQYEAQKSAQQWDQDNAWWQALLGAGGRLAGAAIGRM